MTAAQHAGPSILEPSYGIADLTIDFARDWQKSQMAFRNARRGIWPLQALNFFMADMQAGIGPFLGVFLLAHGWQSGLIGSVMTIGGVAGMVMTGPAGALIDATPHKRSYVVIPGVCTRRDRDWCCKLNPC